ncbi:Uncharacterized protein OBRU01_08397 [Operophtera brumata]|uniref:Major facilitator superfamily (MFS) profile domain-containing protein n=1 Tax=Operophtera brumata TaxID=104452 RepID=A0A0L7LGX8_OPEBR|nr:Uncharacterized protein OBRU01_08397 [Operophtera brumata]
MGENYGVQAQAHQLLGHKTETPRKYDNALTRTLRSCKYDNALTRTLRSCKYDNALTRTLESCKYDNALTRTLRSCKYDNALTRTLRSCKYDNALTRTLRSCCFIPQRYILGVMGLLGVCNAYTMRVCLNLAITQMVKRNKTDGTHNVDPYACPIDEVYAIFDWDEPTQGLILSGFYYGYAATQVPGGYLAEKFGGKWTLGVGLLSTALFTFLTPAVINIGGAPGLFILRVLQGMGEGPTMPALMIMLARWVPPHERSFQGALVFGGAQIGNIFGSFMSGILLSEGRDWAYVFYFFGGFGIFWFMLWSLFCYSTPNTHPFISKKELSYLNKNVTTADNKSKKDPVPWKAILRSAPAWALVWAAVGHDWGYYTMVTDLPKYSHDVLKYNIAKTGTLTALPYIAMWFCSFLFGFICDLCIKKKWHSIKTGRILHTTIVGIKGRAVRNPVSTIVCV